jgi:hypothetical protein
VVVGVGGLGGREVLCLKEEVSCVFALVGGLGTLVGG